MRPKRLNGAGTKTTDRLTQPTTIPGSLAYSKQQQTIGLADEDTAYDDLSSLSPRPILLCNGSDGDCTGCPSKRASSWSKLIHNYVLSTGQRRSRVRAAWFANQDASRSDPRPSTSTREASCADDFRTLFFSTRVTFSKRVISDIFQAWHWLMSPMELATQRT